MSVAVQGLAATVFLYVDQVLTIVADANSSGSAVPLGNPGEALGTPVAVAASATVTIGPFATTKRYAIYADAGTLTYTTATPDPDAAAAAALKSAVLAGGAAGDHTLTGIAVGDAIVSVRRYIGAGVAVTDVSDLTTEFTVAAGKINNAAGTDTTGDKLAVLWAKLT